MENNFAAPLETTPQIVSEVSTGPVGLAREVLRCPACQLVQFRTVNHHCRRCRADVDALLAPPPVLAAARPATIPVAAAEPGLETAEATGTLVPDVASAIRHWRQKCGLSQRQLAERMRVPRTYVSKIENDKATPTITSLERMASAMETNIASLLVDTSAEPDAVPDLMSDAFVLALLPLLGSLGPRHRAELLAASRRLASVV